MFYAPAFSEKLLYLNTVFLPAKMKERNWFVFGNCSSIKEAQDCDTVLEKCISA